MDTMYSGRYTSSVNCCKRFIKIITKLQNEYEIFDTENSSTAYVLIRKSITFGVL